MQLLNWITENREIIKIFYALIIVFICIVITKKSDRIFRLSCYKGIQYLRNAFLFYGIAFALRYFLRFTLVDVQVQSSYVLTNILFEFFLIMAGFFLLYSLLWKRMESATENYTSSLMNMKISIFYLMALLLVTLDYLWGGYIFLFVSQIIVFTVIFAISFSNYRERGKDRKFLKFYLFSVFLALIAWILNALSGLLFNWNLLVVMIIYLLNIFVFLIFLYGIVNVTKGKKQ